MPAQTQNPSRPKGSVWCLEFGPGGHDHAGNPRIVMRTCWGHHLIWRLGMPRRRPALANANSARSIGDLEVISSWHEPVSLVHWEAESGQWRR